MDGLVNGLVDGTMDGQMTGWGKTALLHDCRQNRNEAA